MSQPLPRQQRLFTGALFPEALNAQLFAFAARHRLQSNVWVPHRAFDAALRPYGVFILPKAALCDLSLTPGGSMAEVTETIGTDRVLVNAAHTSHQKFMETFREFLMSRQACGRGPELGVAACASALAPATAHSNERLPSAQLVDNSPLALATPTFRTTTNRWRCKFFSAAQPLPAVSVSDASESSPAMRIRQPDPLWDALPPFHHPLALNGSLLLGSEVAKRLLEWQRQQSCSSPYWRRQRSCRMRVQRYSHMGSSEYPGRYNPFYCVRYVPHNYTGGPFPLVLTALMRHRAVEYGYVSRMWLTQRQGEELFGTQLLPERVNDFPPLYSTAHTGGLECLQYFCADQFANSERLFPSRRELDLASKGVWIDPTKMAAYPLLRQLQTTYAAAAPQVSGERTGVDLARQDVSRHSAFGKLTEEYSNIHLVGFNDSAKMRRFLDASYLHKQLQRQRILCGFVSSVFISHRTLTRMALPLRSGEEGVSVVRQPVPLPFSDAWTSGECWFNITQMREPAIGAELMSHWPRHFFTRRLLHGAVAVRCCRLQIAARRRSGTAPASLEAPFAASPPSASEWVPLFVVQMAGWQLRPGAPGVRYSAVSGGAAFKRFAIADNILFCLADIVLEAADATWMRSYTPKDPSGRLYLRGLRQLLTLRAYERGYRASTWIAFPTSAMDVSHLPEFGLRTTPAPVRPGIVPLDATKHYFAVAPFVRFRGYFFVNEEEMLTDVLLQRWQPDSTNDWLEDTGGVAEGPLSLREQRAQALAEHGLGESAEIFLQHHKGYEEGVHDGSKEDTGEGDVESAEEGEEKEEMDEGVEEMDIPLESDDGLLPFIDDD